MHPSGGMPLYPAPVENNYGGVRAFMVVLTDAQDSHDVSNTVLRLTDLCHATPNAIENQPFLVLTSCFYLDALALRGYHGESDGNFGQLLQFILKICGVKADRCLKSVGWEGLNDAVDFIYSHGNSSEQSRSRSPPRNLRSLSHSLDNPHGYTSV